MEYLLSPVSSESMHGSHHHPTRRADFCVVFQESQISSDLWWNCQIRFCTSGRHVISFWLDVTRHGLHPEVQLAPRSGGPIPASNEPIPPQHHHMLLLSICRLLWVLLPLPLVRDVAADQHTVRQVTITPLIMFRTQKCRSNCNSWFPGNNRASVIVFK